MDDELSNGNHQRWQPLASITNQYRQPPPLNSSKVVTTAVRPWPTSLFTMVVEGVDGGMYGCGREKMVVVEGWGGDEGEGKGWGRIVVEGWRTVMRVADMDLGERGWH
ncbi:hypothetical protein LOK49_LG02G03226 [Camellia lanceoleosa]|uniref:Uncharacterized protein n=1 Tax=Camellia lanceoleosa TaxID=1840588 RepID=A0ACC0IHW5_9ERIC|nr:hypothetical protein LOK49_LG02G03226 [Camellia lanceoleosa]